MRLFLVPTNLENLPSNIENLPSANAVVRCLVFQSELFTLVAVTQTTPSYVSSSVHTFCTTHKSNAFSVTVASVSVTENRVCRRSCFISHRFLIFQSVFDFLVFDSSFFDFSVFDFLVLDFSIFDFLVFDFSVVDFSVFDFLVFDFSVVDFSVFDLLVFDFSVGLSFFFHFSWIICRTASPKLGAGQGGLGYTRI